MFAKLCKDAGVDDPLLVRHLLQGIQLVGETVDSKEFPAQRKEAHLSVEQVMRAARWTRQAAKAKTKKENQDELEKKVWEKSEEEIHKGWLRGPFTDEQLKKELGPLYVVSRRFGIHQHGGVRVIDDMSESLVNASIGTWFKVDLGGVDELAVLARSFVDMVAEDRTVRVRLSTGQLLEGKLHESLTIAAARGPGVQSWIGQ